MQAAVPISATFAVPFCIRPDPDKESSFWLSVVSSFSTRRTNHCHHLIRADNAEQVKAVFRLANRQIAHEVQKLCKEHSKPWNGGIFCKKRASIIEVVGREAELGRLRYLLSQGVKDGLVPHPTKWPGVQSASAWLSGSMKLTGSWIDRTSLYEIERGASRRKKKVTRKWLTLKAFKACERRVVLPLWPLPCMDDMSPNERRAIVHELCGSILIEHKGKISEVPRDWKKRLCNPAKFTYRPASAKHDIVPEVHADSKETWRLWKIEWDNWLNLYTRASERLRKGIAEALHEFPQGCFIPSGVCSSGATTRPPPLPSAG